MKMENQASIAILAYGSLIDEPGDEIAGTIVEMIDCTTPFKVEFARTSKTRGEAPTLIPVMNGGASVKAKLLVIKGKTKEEIENMLWRRETRQKDSLKNYPRKKKVSGNDVVIQTLEDFNGISTVLFTSIGQNIPEPSAGLLAKLAIDSFYSDAGDTGKDGVRYLQAAVKNGIKTALSEDYEKAILKATKSSTLESAIENLSIQKKEILRVRFLTKDFEAKYREIGDLVHSYGLRKTLEGKDADISDFKAFLKENRAEFFINVHEGFKKGQEKIIELMLDFEKQEDVLEEHKKQLTGKSNSDARKKIDEEIRLFQYFENLLRHMIDSIGWQMIQRQLYISRRLYQGVKGKKKLSHSNLASVVEVARELNKVPEDFALITDLSGYFQTGDIMHVSDKELRFIEVKEGKKSKEVFEVMEKIISADEFTPEVFEGVNMDKHFRQQLDRNLKQFENALKVVEIIQTDKGVDKKGRNVKIVTPEENTPRFDDQLRELETRLKNGNTWGYIVLNDCLHIGIYKGPMKLIASSILEGIAKKGGYEYMLVNYRAVVRSLYRPIFSLPFSQDLIYDILFRRVEFFLMIDFDNFIGLFELFGLRARWLTRKETGKLLEGNKREEIFIHKNRSILIEGGKDKQTAYVSQGMLHKLFFEFIYPSYVAYGCRYLFTGQDELNLDELSQDVPASDAPSS